MHEQRPGRVSAPAEIVIVDDEQGILDVLADVLRDEGYVPVVFRDGAEALAYLGRREPGLVITDLRLPAMSGADFIERLRAQCGPALPVAVMSGAASAGTLENLSVQARLTKPFELDAFLGVVRRFASRE